MSKMLHLVEEMHVRLNEIAASEQALLRTLRDALSRVDDKLMQDVRTITAEHETRRRAVLGELQSLASRIGAFPASREPAPELGYAQAEAWPQAVADNGYQRSLGRAQRRRDAGSNITAELDLYFKARAS